MVSFQNHRIVATREKGTVSRAAPPRAGRLRALPVLAAGAAAMAASGTLSGCATLPSTGPTMGQIHKESLSDKTAIPFTIVDLDATNVDAAEVPESPGLRQLAALSADRPASRADLIRKGDTLTIAVYEIGVALFSGSSGMVAGNSAMPGLVDHAPTAGVQTLGAQVREDGSITLPYIGTIMAANSYPETLAATIRQRLQANSEHPDVAVAIADSVASAAYVSGAVTRPGRYRLSAAHEHLLDLIALAGGSPLDVSDLAVTLVRGGHAATVSLDEIGAESPANVQILPGDRLQLTRARKSFTVFGATDKVTQIPFETREVTLAEAIARATGPSDWRANPRGVFLFRLALGQPGERPTGVVYRINLMRADSYFLAQSFKMRDKDAILFSNASSNVAQKLIGLVSQVFAPAVAAKVATQ